VPQSGQGVGLLPLSGVAVDVPVDGLEPAACDGAAATDAADVAPDATDVEPDAIGAPPIGTPHSSQ